MCLLGNKVDERWVRILTADGPAENQGNFSGNPTARSAFWIADR
jgi:hypothetical protein